ncbi:MAG TPA: putative Na+/H+ antiporter [Burkholderiales bacterium]|nr:putative Na+/H+ antiporter [Burkholderiales bacterium]
MHSAPAGHWMELAAAALFGLAVLHTFSTKYFEHLAHTRTAHAGLWHLLGEVEVVFGFWAFVLLVFLATAGGWKAAAGYLDASRFVEPMFVFVIMVICASRPIMQCVSGFVRGLGAFVPLPAATARYFLGLSFVPLLGSLVTEPAAMTLAALMLRGTIFSRRASNALKYATLGVLFVNVSIGGTLTHFAAPPVLMVAAKWGWDTAYVFSMFGWKAAIAVLVNASLVTFVFRRQLAAKAGADESRSEPRAPAALVFIHLAILAGVVASSHHPEAFIGLFLLFLGLAEAYKRHHDRLMLREGLMVAFFLAGLVVLGGQQKWWLQAALSRLSESTLFYGAAALTAITDNAALTYLGSLIDGVSDQFKYALVAGAVAGGGLTVIANAPNPAGFAILKDSFDERSISPLWLLVAALPPTLVAIFCFRGVNRATLEFFDLDVWLQWFRSLDPAFLFLLILPFAVAAVGLWSETLRSARDKRRED